MAACYEIGIDRALEKLQKGEGLYKRPFYGGYVYEFNPSGFIYRITVQAQRLFFRAEMLEQTGKSCYCRKDCDHERLFVLVEDWKDRLKAYKREQRHEKALAKDAAERVKRLSQ